ncbi:hypothetical protein WA026_017157 [Henosepilachna vigintioctopunctata]|uniref:UDP-glucuronosyltransferase n=1 Tax=Henosepilachna vigintioctopunctata TaxID=420089 RepID=A0AAW1UG12_9CUCU
MKILCLLFMLSIVYDYTKCANIMAIIPSPFYSHQATFRPLWRELAKRGHKITLMTTDPMEWNENITQINNSFFHEIYEKHELKKLMVGGHSIFEMFNKLFEASDELIKTMVTNDEFVNILKNEKKFDLIISEIMNPMLPVLYSKLKCPFIEVYSMDAPPYLHALIGNAMHPAIYAFPIFDFQSKLFFTDRLINTLFVSVFHVSKEIIFSPFKQFVAKYTGEDFPSVFDTEKNVSLIFNSANPVFYSMRPVTPITINIGGGLHLTDPKRLPKDLQTYLDGAKHGCIYFSFGSNVNSNFLSPEATEIFRKTFEELAPIKVLWKFENDTMPLKPKNLELKKWLPQQDVLRHPNVKVFITQGGLQSMEEAIDSAVPMLGMPFYGDQINNVKKMVEKDFGLMLDVKTMDSTSLKNSILELLNNPKYKKNIDRLSAISKDEPMRPLEKAVWWTEYLLRHKTTEHLRVLQQTYHFISISFLIF